MREMHGTIGLVDLKLLPGVTAGGRRTRGLFRLRGFRRCGGAGRSRGLRWPVGLPPLQTLDELLDRNAPLVHVRRLENGILPLRQRLLFLRHFGQPLLRCGDNVLNALQVVLGEPGGKVRCESFRPVGVRLLEEGPSQGMGLLQIGKGLGSSGSFLVPIDYGAFDGSRGHEQKRCQ